MIRPLLSVVVLGLCLVGSLGCGMGRGNAFAPAPAKTKKTFAVEGMKQGQWQMVASYPTSGDAMKRAADVRRDGEYQAVRIRSVAFHP